MGVGGGAWYPSAQAALADRHGTRISYLVAMTGKSPDSCLQSWTEPIPQAMLLCSLMPCKSNGISQVLGLTISNSGMVLSQAREGKFRIRNIDEIDATRAAIANAFPSTNLAVAGALPPDVEKIMRGEYRDDEKDKSKSSQENIKDD
jgi:FHS family L-fucose permease-like MFS transporter